MTTTERKRGIQTMYSGATFRSRLEARWAAMFDLLGWRWTYEPIDADGYIPDVLVHGRAPVLAEVKPVVTADQYLTTARGVQQRLAGHWTGDVLILGVDPLSHDPAQPFAGPAAGLIGEYDGDAWCWDAGEWITCRHCAYPAIIHRSGWWQGRPCGHADGDHHLGPIDPGHIARMWNTAHAVTRWAP